LRDLELLERDRAAAHHAVQQRQDGVDFSGLSTISTTMGRSSDSRSTLVVCSRLEWPKPKGPRGTLAPARCCSARFRHDGFIERLVLQAVLLADEDGQQYGVARNRHGIILRG
jgi:hypothetical protein